MDLARLYAVSMHWAFLTLTVGPPDGMEYHVLPSQLYNMFTAAVNCLVVASIVGSLSQLAVSADTEGGEFQTKLRAMLRFMKDQKVPPEMQRRVRCYLTRMDEHVETLE